MDDDQLQASVSFCFFIASASNRSCQSPAAVIVGNSYQVMTPTLINILHIQMNFVNKLKNNFKTTNSEPNSFLRRKQTIEQFMVIHPLFDKIIQTKINKCFQHGHLRNYTISPEKHQEHHHTIMAPTIQGGIKVVGRRPTTRSRTVLTQILPSRPKSTNTVIRSRTTEPRIRKKLEELAKYQEDDEGLKPSLTIHKTKKKKRGSTLK